MQSYRSLGSHDKCAERFTSLRSRKWEEGTLSRDHVKREWRYNVMRCLERLTALALQWSGWCIEGELEGVSLNMCVDSKRIPVRDTGGCWITSPGWIGESSSVGAP
jgi:hypothetical protein